MGMQFDVAALGELLIDFTENGKSAQGNPLFEANPGGAPCNVLSMLKKLGHACAFIGKLGDDMFGKMLRETAEDVGIDTRALILDPAAHTTLAFVHTAENGDRDFSFYRDPDARGRPRGDEKGRRDRKGRGRADLLRPEPPSPAVGESGRGQGADRMGSQPVRRTQDRGQRAGVHDGRDRF